MRTGQHVIGMLLFFMVAWNGAGVRAATKPNIVWIIAEDMSPHFGCYGETTIKTPNVDRMAAEGVRFESAFVTAPVCSASRSALVTGMYQTSIGAHNHRSGRGVEKIKLPPNIIPAPEIMRSAGYWVTNGYWTGMKKADDRKQIGKTDYNFETKKNLYDSNDWRDRAPGQPFFSQIQLKGGKGRTMKTPNPIAPSDVQIPPYYPDDPVIRDDWAQYLNAVMNTDIEVGEVLARLRAESLLDDTYVFFITDHGISHARGKQFVYDEGIRVPLVVRGPGLKAGTVRKDLVAHIDLTATALSLAGVDPPEYMEGHVLFGPAAVAREFVVSARDRCDETVDRLRSVRTDRFKYIRNFYPERPYLQPNGYKDKKAIVQRLRELHKNGSLQGVQTLVMAPTRPREELYDLQSDPWEVKNLASDPQYSAELKRLSGILDQWIESSGDQGRQPESDRIYDSDMRLYLDSTRKKGGEWEEHARTIEENIRQMKKWQAEGK